MSRGESLKKHLEEDLATLHDLLVRSGPLPPRHVRSVGSAIVRKWLIDGSLNQLAHDIDVRFELPAYDTSLVFKSLPHVPEVNCFVAGGIYLGGVPIRSIYTCSASFTGAPPIPLETKMIMYSPGQYLGSKRIYFEGNSFNTEQIITFVANKNGGVHFDHKRDKPWQKQLEKAADYITFGNPNYETKPRVVEYEEPEGSCLIVVPNESGNLWSSLDIEMLSTAQALMNVHVNGERLLIINNQAIKSKPFWKFW